MEAERVRQFKLDWRRRHDAYTAPLKKAIADITIQISAAPDIEAAVDAMYADQKALAAQTADFDAATVEIDEILRNNLRNGRTPYNDVGISEASRNFLNQRLSAITKDKDPSLAARAAAALTRNAAPVQPAAAPQPQTTTTQQPTAVAEPSAPTVQRDQPTAETKSEPAIASEPKLAEAKSVEPPPAPVAPQQPAAQPPNLLSAAHPRADAGRTQRVDQGPHHDQAKAKGRHARDHAGACATTPASFARRRTAA